MIVLFLLCVALADACTCYRQLNTPEEYEWLINTVGIGSFVQKNKQKVVMKEEKKDKDEIFEQEVQFTLQLIAVYSSSNHAHENPKDDHLWVKFVPKSPCSFMCIQSHATYTEKWTIKNNRIVEKKKIQETQSDVETIDSYWKFTSGFQNSYFEHNYAFNISETTVEPEDRASCCHICCSHFMDNMRKKINQIQH